MKDSLINPKHVAYASDLECKLRLTEILFFFSIEPQHVWMCRSVGRSELLISSSFHNPHEMNVAKIVLFYQFKA